MSSEKFRPFSGEFTLERLPKTKKGDLRAWDAADELLLQTVFENQSLNKNSKPTLIINDSFGALSIALYEYQVHNWSDSYLSHCAMQHNVKLNQLTVNQLYIPSTQVLNHQYDLVIIKIPKTLSLLEEQLCLLKPHIKPETTVVAGGMSKHIHNSTLKLFERIVGKTTTSRATKKARLIFAENNSSKIHRSPYPKTMTDNALNFSLSNYANVFAQEHLDIGTRFLINQLHLCPPAKNIIDLGCGNGALGIIAQRHQPLAHISFVDESYMAITSAKENYLKDNTKKDAHFYISDCLSQYEGEKAQLILCNPPFHQAHSIGDQIAWQMFKQSFDKLEKEGELWVIGNRHLAYHSKLKQLFGNCRTVANNKKFVVLVSKRT